MKKISLIKSVTLLLCIFLSTYLTAQVKTRIYDNGIPSNILPLKSTNVIELTIKAPKELNELLESKTGEADKSTEYDNKFAIAQSVKINFLTASEIIEDENYLLYYLSIKAEKALNVSAQFQDFKLSQNAILSIYTKNELTDSITAKENNENKIWATRVYQGNRLNIILKVPKSEKGMSNFSINQISFGYKKYGGEYFGSPGSSVFCNIKIVVRVTRALRMADPLALVTRPPISTKDRIEI